MGPTANARTRMELANCLGDVGLTAGDSLLVHSSFRSLGPIEGGPDAVIDALLDVIGPKGNLMLPTFNYTRPLPEPYFARADTPGKTGIINELGRKRPNAVRSFNPTHSVAVIGPDAERLTRDHLCRAFGIGTPIDRLAKMGGKVLLIGVGHTSNSTIHIAEEYAEIPKVSWYDPIPSARVRLADGSIISHPLDASPSCSSAFGAAEYELRRRGAIADIEFPARSPDSPRGRGNVAGGGACLIQLMKGGDVIDSVVAMLKDRPDMLLCAWPACRACVGARANLRRQGRLRG